MAVGQLPVPRTVPEAILTTDKSAYEQFEPVVVTVSVTNPGTYRTRWGPPTGSAFGFRARGPDDSLLPTHDLSPDVDYLAVPVPMTWGVGQTVEYTFSGLMKWPLWDVTGTVTLEFLFFHDVIASTSFTISPPTGIDSTVVVQMGDASSALLDRIPWTSSIPGWKFDDPAALDTTLDSLANSAVVSQDMREFASYLHALWADVDGNKAEASSRYADFLNAFPGSTYTLAVQQRYPAVAHLKGGTPPYAYADSLRVVKVKVFLQAPYNHDSMSESLGSNLPGYNPYTGPPWGFLWPMGMISNPRGVDWMLASLVGPEDSLVSQTIGLIAPNGKMNAIFTNVPPGHYYMVVDHRNHVAVTSDTLIDMTSSYAAHDFTTGHALGANAQMEIEPGVYAMWAGDANADGQVTTVDSVAWAADFGGTGYLASDFNMDGQVSVKDLVLWLQNRFALAGPFDLGALLDRIAGYPNLAESQGWITDPVLAGDLEGVLQDASLALSSGDSAWASSLLGSALAQVEEGNGGAITTEGYELLKGTIEDALPHLPPILEVKVLLEGAYSTATGRMSTGTNDPTHDDIPLTQPFDSLQDGPWDFPGTESLTAVPKYAIDWVLVYVFTDSSVVSVSPGILDRDGNVVVSQTVVPADSFRIAVQHRNHVMVASDTLVDFAQARPVHDFTTGHALETTGKPAQVLLSDGRYAMWTGDVNRDGQVTAPDFNAWTEAWKASESAYVSSDYDMDAVVDTVDFAAWLTNTLGGIEDGLGSLRQTLEEVYPAPPPPQTPRAFVRLNVVNSTGKKLWVNLEAKANTNLAPNNTVGSATLDFYFNDADCQYLETIPGVLTAGGPLGYAVESTQQADETGAYYRLVVTSSDIGAGGNPGYDLGTDWVVLAQARFERPAHGANPGLSFRTKSLSLGFFDSHGNSNDTNRIVGSDAEVQ